MIGLVRRSVAAIMQPDNMEKEGGCEQGQNSIYLALVHSCAV